MAARIGIDTGGTFTDVVRWSAGGVRVHKVPSTPADPSRAVLAGLAAVREHDGEEVDVVHGTTVGLNAVLTGALARTVFVTNRGCEDVVAIGRQQRADLYALAPHRPVPPVPRERRIGVDCRRGPGGTIDTALTAAAVERAVAAVRAARPEAIAIGFLHSPADPADEHRVARALRAALPGVPVTCSADLLPAFGEYERFCAAILNAAIAPVVGRYTQRLAANVGRGQLRLLRSSLGILPPDEAAAYPARAMFSGPAGGVLATARVAERSRFARSIAFDMGGTSADVCVVDANVATTDASTIAGLPLPLPAVPVHTVGCGGGSIARADAGGALRVGPESAGADPGPACYGKGDEPTVTDAHVALGHLGTNTLLGGAFPIDVDKAVRAVERLGRRLGLSAAAAARGILTVADATMARAILAVTAERAIDPAGLPLVAYGGAGGLHAAGLMARLGIRRAVLPLLPGAFSALGLALAGESVECSEAVRVVFADRVPRSLVQVGVALRRRAIAMLAGASVRLDVHVRYQGQGATLCLPLRTHLPRDFAREHERRYGFTMAAPLEALRVAARAERAGRALPARMAAAPDRHAVPRERRRPTGGGRVTVHDRRGIVGAVHGPAVIEEATATTLVPDGFVAMSRPYGLVIARH